MSDETEVTTITDTVETVVTDSTGAESTVTETRTHEIEAPAVEAPVVEDDGEEAIDETWLNERFSSLSAQLAQLQTEMAEFRVSQSELVNRLISMNQRLQLTITEMVAKFPASNHLTPAASLPENQTPEVVTPETAAPAVAVAPVEVVTSPARVTRRKI